MARGVLMTPSSIPRFDEKHRRLLEDCFRREAGSSTPIPGDDVDLIETGILDSMGWVSFLRAVETASGAADLGSNLNERSASFAVLLSALRDSNSTPGAPERLDSSRGIAQTPALAVIAASSFTVGSRVIPSEEVDRAFGMPAGKLRSRAGSVGRCLLRNARTGLDRYHQRNASRLPFAFGSTSFSITRP